MRADETAAFDAYDDDEAPRRPAEDLRRVARYQRWLIAVVLAQLTLWGGVVGLAVFSSGRWSFQDGFPLFVTLLLGAVGGVYVFLLCWELRRGGIVALFFGLATVVPVLGLLVLTLTNSYATAELRTHRVPVGVFGASQLDIPDEPSLYDADEDAGW